MLGYASEKQYCRERLGISRSSLRKKVALATQVAKFAELERVVLNGSIGSEAALLLARVMTVETESVWVARAKERTFKHLREEVELVEFAARVNGDRSAALPPDADEIESFEKFVSEVLSGRMMRVALGVEQEDDVAGAAVATDDEAVQISGGDSLPRVASPPAAPPALPALREGSRVVQISGGSDSLAPPSASSMPLGPRHAVRVRVREEFDLWFRALEASYERLGGEPERFVAFLCTAVWQSWAPLLGNSDVWEKIYERDGYRCRCPVCFALETTLHHLLYRSRGGTHAKLNLISLCPFCHLKGEHEARLKVRGTADAPKWILGRRPILVVEGRVKRAPREDERRVS